MDVPSKTARKSLFNKLATFAKLSISCATTGCILLASSPAQADVSQVPLVLGSGNVPGSLALVPSVEWPTILSVANIGNYSSATEYVGYFDSNKCYVYTASGADRWFSPVAAASARRCSGSRQWSGNFLNWVGTPTIDPFRSALTGGLRYKDDVNLTVLQKARHDGQNSTGNRGQNGGGLVPASEMAGAMPIGSDWSNVNIRLSGLGQDLVVSNWNDKLGDQNTQRAEWIDLDPSNSYQWNNNRLVASYRDNGRSNGQVRSVYRIKVQVEVCKPGMLESNCKRYGSNYKPEGLLQQYAADLRYSVFSYLNDSSWDRDGGVLRANQKYVGPKAQNNENNPIAEWSATSGILVKNPDKSSADATNAGIVDSGVINYINKFGSMTTRNHKSLDPVSELYYTAIRYFKNQGNVAAYSNLTGDKYQQADGFPVITQWQDPVTYSCQKNVILGIGDVNTHRDKNLPGPTSSEGEPAKPAEVAADQTVDVVAATRKVGSLENVDLRESSGSYTGRNNSAYIAGLAYDSNTKDIRPDRSGKQTISTYWVDVRENQFLEPKRNNQYWLAAKYGGLRVPRDFDPYADTTTSAALTDAMWWTNGETLSTGDKRPDNFFVASDARRMVESLKTAFAQIVQETRSSTTSLATNSTQLDTGSAVFQSQFNSQYWSGDLLAKPVNTSGTVSSTASWSAASKLDALANPSVRKIFTGNAARVATDNSTLASGGLPFLWSNGIDDAVKAALRRSTNGTDVADSVAQSRLLYLRGDRSQEKTEQNPDRPFRQRASRLGDIVNSDPQYIHRQDYGYNLLQASQWSGAGAAYLRFRSSDAYQSRTPIVAIGANDGMFHVFDGRLSGGGDELFAYIPRNVTPHLYTLTEPSYAHRYFVDGTASSSDVWMGSESGWKTIVAGTTGAGGNSVFVLDVTTPSNLSASSVLWEFSAPEIGNMTGQPSIAALPNGRFGVIVASGYPVADATNGYVWVLDAADGSVIKRFTLPTSGTIGTPLAIDTNNDRVADRLYVGDTNGNLWRMDLADSPSASSLSQKEPIKLFTARDGANRTQPITAPLTAALNSDGNPIILFGTGSYFRTTDTDLSLNSRVEAFYGIIDTGDFVTRSDLAEQKILREVTQSERKGRVLSDTAIRAGQKGWFLDLQWKRPQGGSDAVTGERVIAKPVLRGGVLTFTTVIPSSDPCSGGGSSWVMSTNVLTGGRLSYNYFDMNGDGLVNDQDFFDDGKGNLIPYSGQSDPERGVIKTPSFFNGQNPDDGTPRTFMCFAGSSGQGPECVPVSPDATKAGRISWREERTIYE